MLKGLGQLGDMAGMMKKAQEMQSKMAEAQEKIADMTAQGEAGAGLVTCEVSGKGDVVSLTVDPTILVPEEKEVIEDLILAALKDGKAKADAMVQAEMGKVTEGLNLPEGMKLPF